MEQQFSIGEYVERKVDGQIGVIRKVEPWDGDYVFYVDFDGRNREEDLWAGTTPAWKRMDLHAHVETDSADCDGRYTSGRVEEMTLEERCDQFWDLHFKERILGNTVSFHGTGTVEVSPSGLHWYEQTDEGYRRVDVEWCEQDCDDVRSWQRDHSAEKAGY